MLHAGFLHWALATLVSARTATGELVQFSVGWERCRSGAGGLGVLVYGSLYGGVGTSQMPVQHHHGMGLGR